MCEADGSNPVQVTSFNKGTAGAPRWSPDGVYIAFDARPQGHADVYVVDAEGGEPRRMTNEPSDDILPSWSPDGRWIYFCSNRDGSEQVWKVSAEGGEAVQVTKRGRFLAVESPDGKSVYYLKGPTSAGVWKVPVSGGEETQVLDAPKAGYWADWEVVEDGIYFIDPEAGDGAVIEFFDFASRRMMRIAGIGKVNEVWPLTLSISPDRRRIIYTLRGPINSDIMLVENFR